MSETTTITIDDAGDGRMRLRFSTTSALHASGAGDLERAFSYGMGWVPTRSFDTETRSLSLEVDIPADAIIIRDQRKKVQKG